LSRPTGRIEANWRIDQTAERQEIVFEWREKGGPEIEAPQRKGFGAELLERTLAFELKGKTELAFDPAGLRCTITIPLNRRVVHTPALEV
jgi:two-component system, chemotaxis family, CheB/CheR fusion protein